MDQIRCPCYVLGLYEPEASVGVEEHGGEHQQVSDDMMMMGSSLTHTPTTKTQNDTRHDTSPDKLVLVEPATLPEA